MAERAIVHTWRVGRWTVELSVPPIALGQVTHAVVEWSPSPPDRPLSASELRQYHAGLAIAIQRAASGGPQGRANG